MTEPTAIHGRRRPQRVRVRSDSTPMAGSITASHSRANRKIAPIVARLKPKIAA
jgi:hypothetical protein